MGALWEIKEHCFQQRHHISQWILDNTTGEDGYEVQEVNNIPSIEKWENSSQ